MSQRSKSATGGQIIVETLLNQGVDTAFCVPGESYLEVLDSLYSQSDRIKLVTCRHENGAGYMAESYAKLTGKVGVALVTRGPGACNASIAVHTAFQDSSPMILFVGHVRREDIGREAFQEVDYDAMFGPLAKAVRMIKHADDAAADVTWGLETALSGRPGPVVLVLPEDMLRESSTNLSSPPVSKTSKSTKSIDPGELERLHRRLGDAERPILMVGGSDWTDQACTDIQAFAENQNLPVVATMRRMDIVDNRLDCYVGEMGIGPNPKLLERVKAADLIIAVGCRLGEMTTQSYTLFTPEETQHKLVHVHVDGTELGHVFPPALGIQARVRDFAAAAKHLPPANPRWEKWTAQARSDYVDWRQPDPVPGELDLAACMLWLNERLPQDCTITTDAGNFAGWAARYLTFGGGRRMLGPTSGAMGYGVPAGVAASIVQPDRPCVVMVGDGGFGMTGQEISTAMDQGAKPIILLFNNAAFGTIRMHQERNYPERVIATKLHNPDFIALALAHGAFGERVNMTDQFAGAFERALAAQKTAIIELQYDVDVITTRTTLENIRNAAKRNK